MRKQEALPREFRKFSKDIRTIITIFQTLDFAEGTKGRRHQVLTSASELDNMVFDRKTMLIMMLSADIDNRSALFTG